MQVLFWGKRGTRLKTIVFSLVAKCSFYEMATISSS